MKSLEERFWSKVDKSGDCWEWTAAKSKAGYGLIGRGGREDGLVYAHRLAWSIAHGDPGSLCVLHRCDNPGCVNPDHLFLGTKSDNIKDMDSKGRRVTPVGEAAGRAKLTDDQVIEIRAWRSAGFTIQSVSKAYGVSMGTVSQIATRRTWKHIP